MVLLVILISCKGKQDQIFPERTTITESVYSSVTVQPDSLYEIYSAVGGILDYNYVEEGDFVTKGDTLIQVINNAPKINTENARLSLELAKDNYNGRAAILDEIKDEIQAAELKYKNDSINYSRQKNLWKQQIGSKIDLDTRKLSYELSGNTLALLKNKYNRTARELETQLKQAENNYKTSLITNRDFTIRSKIDGKVYALYKNPGEIVSLQEPLGSIGSAGAFIVEMLVDEVDIVKVSAGQEVLINLDSYKEKIFKATVTKIYPKKDERSQTFKVEAIFNSPPKVLYPGLSGEGNIIIAIKKQAITIPKDYLFDGNKVQTTNGIIEVKTGLQDLERVEIREGIDENTPILKPLP